MEAYVAKYAAKANQNAIVKACANAGQERLEELWIEYRAAA